MKFLRNNKIMEIREATPSDAEAIFAYFEKEGAETNNLIKSEYGKKTKALQKEFLDSLVGSEVDKAFVGFVDGEMISLTGVKTKGDVADVSTSVCKAFENVNAETHMMNHVLNFCRITGVIKRIILKAKKGHNTAISFYEKFGFKKTDEVTTLKEDGKTFEAIIMEMYI